MQQKLFQNFFLLQEAGSFGNDIGKEPQKPHPKLKKICILYIYYVISIKAKPAGISSLIIAPPWHSYLWQ